jgi:signal peptidase (SPase) II
MIRILNRYYAVGLVSALVAPLWLGAALGKSDPGQMKDALIWTAIFVGCGLLITKNPGYHVRGGWRNPTPAEAKFYMRLLLGVLLVDFGSKALFFSSDRPYQIEVMKNFGLQSVFHATEFETIHFVLMLYFLYVFVFGALFFRFSSKSLDRLWLISSTFALGGAIALFGERLMFGGVHDSFYLAGPLMWFCPPCASPYFASYAWTPADFFVHATIAPVFILIASYFVSPPVRSYEEAALEESAQHLQSRTP